MVITLSYVKLPLQASHQLLVDRLHERMSVDVNGNGDPDLPLGSGIYRYRVD